MHYTNNKIENKHELKKYKWQKEHLPNQTGTKNSYHPKNNKNATEKKYKSWQKLSLFLLFLTIFSIFKY